MQKNIPAPKSRFLLVVCNNCKNRQIVFEKIASEVKCLKCNEVLALPTGGKGRILGKIIKILH